MKPKDQILARMYVALTLLGLAPLAVAAQMGQIVVTETDALRDQVRAQARSSVTIPAMRGAIRDRDGQRGEAQQRQRHVHPGQNLVFGLHGHV